MAETPIGMRAIVTCEPCGYKQALLRRFTKPEVVRFTCHGCERVLVVDIDEAALAGNPQGAREHLLMEFGAWVHDQ
jgi:hypothetical protein